MTTIDICFRFIRVPSLNMNTHTSEKSFSWKTLFLLILLLIAFFAFGIEYHPTSPEPNLALTKVTRLQFERTHAMIQIKKLKSENDRLRGLLGLPIEDPESLSALNSVLSYEAKP